jgi:sugar lactone lactonase YvrE
MLNPGGVAFDASGNLYIASWPYVRKVSLAGTITTVAGGGAGGDGGPATSALLNNHFVDVTVDSAGNFYISEDIKGDVRKINTAGIISTVAGTGISGYSGDGGPATGAGLNTPLGLAVDATGNLYIADQGNLRVRKVSTTGTITTVAGNGTPGFSGDGGPATSAETYGPEAAAIDAAGNLYFVDQGRVRKVVNP